MKEVKYVPSVCEGEAPTFKGHVVLRAPTYIERLEYLEKVDIKDGSFVAESGMTQLKAMKTIVQITMPHYVSVDLERLSDCVKFNSFEEMAYDSGCDQIISEVGMKVLGGFGPSGK